VTTIENGGADGSIASSDSDNARASTPSTVADTEPDVTSPDSDLATIADIVAADADLAFLSLLLAESDVDVSDGRITLFAPNDAAFDAVPSDLLERLQNDRDLLDDVLAHHVVDGVYTTADLVDGELTASDGQMLEVTTGTEIAVGGATLVGTDTIASNGVVHVVDSLILPPDAVTRAAGDTSATAVRYDGEKVVLTGVVASEVDRQVLIGAAAAATSPDLVIDELTVDPDTGAGAMLAERLGALISAMPANLRSGEVGFDGTDVYAGGIMRSEVGRDAFIAAAAAVDVEADVVVPPQATDDDAAELETQLNAVVAENPILFEPSSAVLSASALPVIDRIAADAQQFDGLQITVEGHTDSDGAPIENLQLSQNRAQAVQAALVERGLDADVVEAVGFGSERPVIVDGTEDKGASRRVEFRVITAP
jgi:OOP family OmpA-OmpF porin